MHVRSEVRLTSTGALVVWGEREFVRTGDAGFEMDAVVTPPPPQPITTYRAPDYLGAYDGTLSNHNTGYPAYRVPSGGERFVYK